MSSNYVNLESEERVQDSTSKWSARWIGKVALMSVVLVVVVVVCVAAVTSGASKVEANGVSHKLANQMDDSFVAADKINTNCYLPAKIGLCRAYFPRYYFNKCTGRCEPFIYGGCMGNANNFNTLAQCQSACRFNPVQPCPKLAAESEKQEAEKAAKKVVAAKDTTGADVKVKQDGSCSVYKLSSAGYANVFIGSVSSGGSVYKLSSAGYANVFAGSVNGDSVYKLSSAGYANVFTGRATSGGSIYKLSSAGYANVYIGSASSGGSIYKLSSAGYANVFAGSVSGSCNTEQKGGAALLLGLV